MNFENLNFNLYNIIIVAGIIHGIIFSLILFINKKLNSKTNYYLAFTVLALSFSNLQYMLMDIGVISRYKYETNQVLYIPFEFLMLPFFYLFVKSYLNEKINANDKRYLFIPFAFCLLYLLTTNSINNELSIIKFLNLIIEYISIVFSVLVIFLVFRVIKIYESNHLEYSSSYVTIKTKWLKRFLYTGLMLCMLWFLSLNLFGHLFKKGFYKIYPLWIGMSILIYWIGYSAILQKHLYKERKEIRTLIKEKIKPKSQTITKKNNSKLYTKITNWILENELYLNPNLNLDIITKEFKISNSYLSQIFNTHSALNFNDYINQLRVKEVEQMLKNKDYEMYTILAIGLESGFNSKSSFYAAFKKFTKQTPAQYKKLVQNS